MTKAEASGIIWLIVIGLPIWLIYQLGEAIGWVWFGIVILLVVAGYLWHRFAKQKAYQAELVQQQAQQLRLVEDRRLELLKKYGDEKVVDGIMRRTYWQGQTAEQLRDSLGAPEDIDETVMKTKRKHVWKYHPLGGNRFGLRITLEQEQVIGWEEKA